MYIDAIEQWTGDLGDVALDHGRSAHALTGLVVEVTAGLRVSSLLNPASFICQLLVLEST
jgi:hypothetical protein